MIWAVFEQLKLSLGIFIFYFLNTRLFSKRAKLKLPSLSLIIKWIKFKHNNVFINKFVSMRLDLSIYNIISLYVYMYKNTLILDLNLNCVNL